MSYLISAAKQFQYYKSLGEKTFEQLTDEQLFWQEGEESNSIATIVKHLWGNMMSRWTDFLTTDGEKEWREREAEFENDIRTREEMMMKWEEGWTCLFNALESLNENNITTIIYIRNQGHTITDAINRQLCHYNINFSSQRIEHTKYTKNYQRNKSKELYFKNVFANPACYWRSNT